MAIFRYSEVRKGVLVLRGAETHEVVASDPRIDGIRAILVHFGRFLGHLVSNTHYGIPSIYPLGHTISVTIPHISCLTQGYVRSNFINHFWVIRTGFK